MNPSVKKPTRESKRRGFIGVSGSFTMLWQTTAEMPLDQAPSSERTAAALFRGETGQDAHVDVPGKALNSSIKERALSIAPASARRALNSGTSFLNRSVTSMTGALSLP